MTFSYFTRPACHVLAGLGLVMVLGLAGCGAGDSGSVSDAGSGTGTGPAVGAPQTAGPSLVGMVSGYLDQIEAHPDVNAYIHVDVAQALNAAERLDAAPAGDALLRGVVLAVKDNVHVAGMPNTAGTPALAGFTPDRSAPLVQTLVDAGAIVLGKANMHELAYGITSQNFAYGPVRNPIDTTRIPGGSSGGSAAAVAADMANAAIGTDTGASVRLPAALTGIVGFRPTIGRYEVGGITPVSHTRDTPGFMAKTVGEVALLDAVAAGLDQPVQAADLASVTLGVPRAHFYEGLDHDVAAAMEAAIATIKASGVRLVEADLPDISSLNEAVSFPVALYETSQDLPEYLAAYDTGVDVDTLLAGVQSPDVQGAMSAAFGGAIPDHVYQAAINVHRPALRQVYADYFDAHGVDAVVFPTSPITARPIEGILDGVRVGGETHDTFATYIQNTDPGSNAGIPGISIPIGVDSAGLPIGLEIDGPEHSDDRVLAVALALEAVLTP